MLPGRLAQQCVNSVEVVACELRRKIMFGDLATEGRGPPCWIRFGRDLAWAQGSQSQGRSAPGMTVPTWMTGSTSGSVKVAHCGFPCSSAAHPCLIGDRARRRTFVLGSARPTHAPMYARARPHVMVGGTDDALGGSKMVPKRQPYASQVLHTSGQFRFKSSNLSPDGSWWRLG